MIFSYRAICPLLFKRKSTFVKNLSTFLDCYNFEVDPFFSPGVCFECPLYVREIDGDYCCVDGVSSACPVKILTVDDDEYV